MIDKIKAYGWAVTSLALAILLGIQSWRLNSAQYAEIEAKNELLQAQLAAVEQHSKLTTDYRNTEQDLTNENAKTNMATSSKVQAVGAAAAALRSRVRIAENCKPVNLSCPSPVASAPEAGTGDSEPGFLATIGEEDVEEARRADEIRLHLEAVYEQYDRAKDALAKYQGVE